MTAFDTRVCELFEIEYPLLLAGMGGVSGARLVAAVSNSGGLGVLGGATMGVRTFRDEIRATKELTDRPFAVDLLAPDPEMIRAHMRVVYEEGVRIFVAGLAVPDEFIGEMHERGIKVVVMTGKVEHALKAAAAGADAVVAQGTEAGGHTGEIGTMALVPQVVDAVDIPVLAAGGICDGRGLVASLALGAEGVVVGTRFVATREAAAAPGYREAIVESGSADTVRTRCFTGKPARTIRNRYTDEWRGRESEIQRFPLQVMRSAELGLMAYMNEDCEAGPDSLFMPAGQGMGMIESIEDAPVVFRMIIEEAESILSAPPFSG
ncbi:MAG: NAD(P)H-dependent flavin oxidoreductase [Candidatus Binatia bacterium]